MRVKRFFQLYMDLISFACGIIVGALILIVFLDISAYKESLPFPWDAIGAVGTLLAAIIAVLTYRSSVKRQKNKIPFVSFRQSEKNTPIYLPKPISLCQMMSGQNI